MKTKLFSMLAVVLACVGSSGCASIHYGPLTVPSFGKNVQIGDIAWKRVDTNGTVEAWTIKGTKSDSTETVHTVGNVTMGVLGAIAGSSGGPAGIAVGSALGLGSAEIWQTVSDWMNKGDQPVAPTTPAPTPTQPSPEPAPVQPAPQASGATNAWTSARFWTCPDSVRDWPVVSSLTVEIRGGKPFFTTDKPELWPNIDGTIGNVVCLLYRDGQWQAGPIDGMRPFSQAGGDRTMKIGAIPDGDNRKWEAISGETVGFSVTGQCRRGEHMSPKQRTEVAWIVWP
jgi:hypothetical protein